MIGAAVSTQQQPPLSPVDKLTIGLLLPQDRTFAGPKYKIVAECAVDDIKKKNILKDTEITYYGLMLSFFYFLISCKLQF